MPMVSSAVSVKFALYRWARADWPLAIADYRFQIPNLN
jgi:hypothetical protein